MDDFILKMIKEKNSETTEQEQNISFKSKDILISPEDSGLKGPLTNTMTKVRQH